MPLKFLIVGDYSDRFDKVISYSLWADAFRKHPAISATLFNLDHLTSPSKWPALASSVLLQKHDVIVFLQSTFWIYGSRRWMLLKRMMRLKQAVNVFYLVNEYRMIKSQLDAAQELNTQVIVSQMPQDVVTQFYGRYFKGLCLSLPYGLDTAVFKPLISDENRDIDIGFRGNPYPIYLGHNDRELALSAVRDHAAQWGIRVDLDMARDTLAGHEEWPQFLNRCRGIVGHEAGTNFLEYNDSVRNFINDQQERLSADEFSSLIQDLHNDGVFRTSISGRSLAPRHFDAIGTETCQILLSGRYNDLLRPDEHYIELKRDLSNLHEVREKFMDKKFRLALVKRAREYAVSHHTYKHRIDSLLNALQTLG